jgi:O-antigen/teichoic acid export membrane protein
VFGGHCAALCLAVVWLLRGAPPVRGTKTEQHRFRLAAGAVVAVAIVAAGVYFVFWRACRPWTGWFVWAAAVAAAAAAVFAASRTAAGDKLVLTDRIEYTSVVAT